MGQWTQPEKKAELTQQLLDFAVEGLKELQETLEYEEMAGVYAVAFDCNAIYGRVLLAANTEEEFAETLESYQSGPYAERYKDPKKIEDLRYNSGDWLYPDFDSVTLIDYVDFEKLIEDPNERVEWFLDLCREAIVKLEQTEAFKTLSKTDDFLLLCRDHDESIAQARENLEQKRKEMQ